MNNRNCTYKHLRGKNEGNFCCRKINTNIEDGKEDYLCCIHSKKHIPQKRKCFKNNNIGDAEKITKDKSINLDVGFNNNVIKNKENINNDKYILFSKNMKKRTDDINIKKTKIINKKLNTNFLEKNIKNYNYNNNVICKYGNDCHNNKCTFKHKNNELSLLDFIINKNKLINSFHIDQYSGTIII